MTIGAAAARAKLLVQPTADGCRTADTWHPDGWITRADAGKTRPVRRSGRGPVEPRMRYWWDWRPRLAERSKRSAPRGAAKRFAAPEGAALPSTRRTGYARLKRTKPRPSRPDPSRSMEAGSGTPGGGAGGACSVAEILNEGFEPIPLSVPLN